MKNSGMWAIKGLILLLSLCLLAHMVLAVESSRAITSQPRPDEPTDSLKSSPSPPTDFLYFKINYVYRSQGQGAFQVLENDSTLRSGDQYKIIFTPNQDCYVYIFQVDSANMVYSLFPMEQFGTLVLNNVNPVQAGQTYYLPAEEKSFILDDQTGTEHIYFLASFARDRALEEEYQQIAERQQHQKLEEQLQQIDALLHKALRLKGEADLIPEPAETEIASWQEAGQTFLVLQQRLENMCDGCVHVLRFKHHSK